MKRSYPPGMIAAIFVAALMLGLVPTTALAAQVWSTPTAATAESPARPMPRAAA